MKAAAQPAAPALYPDDLRALVEDFLTGLRFSEEPATDRLVERLERAAAELRSGDLGPDRAAALVDECARLAAEAGAELDREVRAADAGSGPAGQLALDQ